MCVPFIAEFNKEWKVECPLNDNYPLIPSDSDADSESRIQNAFRYDQPITPMILKRALPTGRFHPQPLGVVSVEGVSLISVICGFS